MPPSMSVQPSQAILAQLSPSSGCEIPLPALHTAVVLLLKSLNSVHKPMLKYYVCLIIKKMENTLKTNTEKILFNSIEMVDMEMELALYT